MPLHSSLVCKQCLKEKKVFFSEEVFPYLFLSDFRQFPNCLIMREYDKQKRPFSSQSIEMMHPFNIGKIRNLFLSLKLKKKVSQKMIAFPLRMARLCYQFASGKLQCHCGGTLITSQHVLTAYHCTHNRIAADDPDIQRCTKRDVSESRQIGDVTKTGEVVILGRNKLTELDLEQADLIMNPIIGLFVHQKKSC